MSNCKDLDQPTSLKVDDQVRKPRDAINPGPVEIEGKLLRSGEDSLNPSIQFDDKPLGRRRA
jgi:hypothetical protein